MYVLDSEFKTATQFTRIPGSPHTCAAAARALRTSSKPCSSGARRAPSSRSYSRPSRYAASAARTHAVRLRGEADAEIRIPGDSARAIDGAVGRVWPAGSKQIESMQFSTITGGDLLTDPRQTDQSLESFTLFDVMPESDAGLLPGRRAKVRVKLEPSTLMHRAVTRVRQYFDGRSR